MTKLSLGNELVYCTVCHRRASLAVCGNTTWALFCLGSSISGVNVGHWTNLVAFTANIFWCMHVLLSLFYMFTANFIGYRLQFIHDNIHTLGENYIALRCTLVRP
jgi:hypothetical protein